MILYTTSSFIRNQQTNRHCNKQSVSHNSGLQFQPFVLNSHRTKSLHFLITLVFIPSILKSSILHYSTFHCAFGTNSANRRVGIQDHIYSGIVPEFKTCFKVAQMS
jgi:hypothetical protein